MFHHPLPGFPRHHHLGQAVIAGDLVQYLGECWWLSYPSMMWCCHNNTPRKKGAITRIILGNCCSRLSYRNIVYESRCLRLFCGNFDRQTDVTPKHVCSLWFCILLKEKISKGLRFTMKFIYCFRTVIGGCSRQR